MKLIIFEIQSNPEAKERLAVPVESITAIRECKGQTKAEVSLTNGDWHHVECPNFDALLENWQNVREAYEHEQTQRIGQAYFGALVSVDRLKNLPPMRTVRKDDDEGAAERMAAAAAVMEEPTALELGKALRRRERREPPAPGAPRDI